MTQARRRSDGSAASIDGLMALAESVPPLPGARCKGRGALFDGETIADRIRAERICTDECPALGRCRRWVASLSPSRRPSGVVAGRYREALFR